MVMSLLAWASVRSSRLGMVRVLLLGPLLMTMWTVAFLLTCVSFSGVKEITWSAATVSS